jgi:acyl-CoA synthetase (AMP-forming)/AMP-acid ligase II
LASHFDAAALVRSVERDRVTLLSLVPTLLSRLLDEQPGWRPPAHLRAILLGGDGAPPALLRRAADRGLPVLTTYGLTETCGQVATQRPGTPPGPGAPPLPGVAVRVVHGRIEVRGPALMTAYFPRAAHDSPFVEDGWLRTGDLGRIDGEGALHVWGRWDDRIVTGGETVHPGEVERALEDHPAVREACVVGLADARWGQTVAAALVAEGEPSLGEIEAFAARQLAPFRRPRRWCFVEALPRTPAGKLDRAAAARRFGG